ncbi:hypothetical protein OS493_000604 [Desmophyllum pertusum]|uniref:Uncharacterized protein n=1 Tax=Desmophyllum pertusum TaxID=174260 RepID=A0A9X0DCD1_9CNID|nr:hypothetical protein OS493_000604 [Desmophyllum pertusum]
MDKFASFISPIIMVNITHLCGALMITLRNLLGVKHNETSSAVTTPAKMQPSGNKKEGEIQRKGKKERDISDM